MPAAITPPTAVPMLVVASTARQLQPP